MSFILDALRKSETERQQQTGPGLADSNFRKAETKKSIWIPLLVAGLAANAIILAFVVNSGTEETAGSTSAAPDAGMNPAFRPLAREIPRQATTDTSEPTPVKQTAISTPDPAVAQFDAGSQDSVETAPAGAIQDGLPSFQQLVLSGQLSVQPLHLDIHVYANNRPERFVFINMKKYREGDNLAEGPEVEEITTTGVILAHRGNRFTLDRD